VTDQHLRHPVKNFFVKKTIQTKIIWQIIVTVVISACLTTGILTFLYNLKARHGSFYYMSDNIMQDLELKNILQIILPSVISVEIIAILIAFGISLISSRKIAVPIYKIEQWAARLKSGKLSTKIVFRESDHLNDLTAQCNGVTEFYQSVFIDIQKHTAVIAQKSDNPESVKKEVEALQKTLAKVQL
jgi:methyl-accepting chemotaxis protein